MPTRKLFPLYDTLICDDAPAWNLNRRLFGIPLLRHIICIEFLKAKRSQHYGKFEVNFYIHR